MLGHGSLLAGRYQIGALIGQVGMGSVYAARDADLDEEVALKLLRHDLASDEEYRARLRSEVRLARRVSHPNVCRVHDLRMAGELVFVTMELVHGRTLRQLLVEIRSGHLPPFELAQVVDVIVQVGSGLTAAHRAGVIHRDVKPDNVMLTDGRAVLTDFGVATRPRGHVPSVLSTEQVPTSLRHERTLASKQFVEGKFRNTARVSMRLKGCCGQVVVGAASSGARQAPHGRDHAR